MATARVSTRTGPSTAGVELDDDFGTRPRRDWGATQAARILTDFRAGKTLREMALATRVDQFDIAEYLARAVYRTEGRVTRDASCRRYGRTYEQWEVDLMKRWGQDGVSFDAIVAKLERDRLGVAMRMIALGVGRKLP